MLKYPSVLASVVAAGVLAVASTVRPLPWWIWLTWAVLTGLSLLQARRSRHA